jgi:hypothetical protein
MVLRGQHTDRETSYGLLKRLFPLCFVKFHSKLGLSIESTYFVLLLDHLKFVHMAEDCNYIETQLQRFIFSSWSQSLSEDVGMYGASEPLLE